VNPATVGLNDIFGYRTVLGLQERGRTPLSFKQCFGNSAQPIERIIFTEAQPEDADPSEEVT